MKTSSQSGVEQSTNTTICKFYNRETGCKFGDKCRYRHEKQSTQEKDDVKIKIDAPEKEILKDSENQKSEKIKTNSKNVADGSHDERNDGALTKQRLVRRPLCRYFIKSGFCRDGDRCRFLHQARWKRPLKITSNQELTSFEGTTEENDVSNKIPDSSATTDQPNKPKRPGDLNEKLSKLTDEGVQYLQDVEIEQLKKRFGNTDLKIAADNHGTVCTFQIKPSDPDWPYDVTEFQLKVTFPKDYPKQIFKAEVIDDDGDFPANFTKYINSDIEKHLRQHGDAQKLRDSPDLLFRPFIRWLDRNLESLFTKALKQIKFDVEARSAGLEFFAFDNKNGEHKNDNKNKQPETQEITHRENKENLFVNEIAPVESETKISGDAMFEMIESRKSTKTKKGTEIRFRGMELHENTATVRVTSLSFTVQCNRCKNRDDLPNVKENTQVVLTCSKCYNAQSIVLTSSEVVHQRCTTLAYISPQGCSPIDLILSECQLVLGCLHCSKETSIKGINYGSTKNVWCEHCHNKLDMKVESARFYKLQPASIADDKIKTVELKKNAKKKDPAIKSGQALPENGTCKHYKKSYRWMRFPCCGKCYPCDKCHEENEDGHEMEQATRMICGFCAKEQPFGQKGCVSCKSFVTAVHTSHWEGGKGCRNKIKMSRGDDKKYTDKSKTVSRHALKVEGQKKK